MKTSHAEKVKALLYRKAENFWNDVNEIAGQEFDSFVKPYLLRQGYSFSAGMGAWSIQDADGEQVDKQSIPALILSILEMPVPFYDHELGSCMVDWEPED